jgi:integrase/recombinase XerD
MGKAVSLQVRVRTRQGWKFVEPILDVQDRPKKNAYWDKDEDTGERVGRRWLNDNDGTYYLDYRQGGKRVRENVGRDRDLGYDLWRRKQAELTAVSQGIEVSTAGDKGPSLVETVKEYLEDKVKPHRKPRTYSAYSLSLGYFTDFFTKGTVADIDRGGLLKWKVYLLNEEELAPRTVKNHMVNAATFLKSYGRERLLQKGDYPEVTEEEVEVYEPEQIEKFFATCNQDEYLLFKFFHLTGFREQEVMHAEWRDIFPTSVKVTHKRHRNWQPKAYREREVPVPAGFIRELLASKPGSAKANDLIFGTSSGKTDGHMLRTLKRIVARAGLNCGYCDSCIARNECEHWWLHKWRATFATTSLEQGGDKRPSISTVQKWLGHKDLASTQRYVRGARGESAQASVEAIWKYEPRQVIAR